MSSVSKSPTITKADLAEALRDELPDLTARDAVDLVDLVVETIIETLEDGKDVLVTGFGRWSVREKKERPGRNPVTGEVIPIPARKVVVFKPSRVLRERMNREGLICPAAAEDGAARPT